MAQKSKKLYKGRIVGIALVIFTIYIIVSLVWIHKSIQDKNAELADLQAQIDEQTVENQEIQELLDEGVDEDYIIRVAREQLDFVFPNERVYRDVIGQ